MTLTHFSLFSGIGGIDLAAEWAGFETVGQCEFADYPTKVLEKHWPDVPRWRDVRDVTAESVRGRGIANITVLSGGFPCQPFSVAGKRRGKEDDRFLWPEMLRVISELQPAWIIGENVPGIVNMALEQCCIDLENQGYEVQPFNIPACGVDAPHRRARIFIMAYSIGNRRGKIGMGKLAASSKNVGDSKHDGLSSSKIAGIFNETSNHNQKGANQAVKFEGASRSECGRHVADPNDKRLQITGLKPGKQTTNEKFGIKDRGWWPIEPNVGRVANGISHRVDRLKCLGNAVVPQQVYPILQAIADIEKGLSV